MATDATGAPPPAGRCEDDVREDLIAQLGRLDASGIPARTPGSVSVRWRRSGADGLLLTPPERRPGELDSPDQLDWYPLAQAGAAGDKREGTRVGMDSDPATTLAIVAWHRQLHGRLARAEAGRGAVHSGHATVIMLLSPPFATTLACAAAVQRDGIPRFHPLVSVAGGDSIRCSRPAGTDGGIESVLAALAGRKACLVGGSGLLAIAADAAAGVALAADVESIARIYWQLLQAGSVPTAPHPPM